MVRAAVARHLDFTQAHPNDPSWYLRLQFVLQEMERQDRTKIFHLDVLQGLAYVASGKIPPDKYFEVSRWLQDSLQNYTRSLQCFDLDRTQEYVSLAQDLKTSWEQEWGSLDSPEAQAAIDATIECLRLGMQN